MNVQVEALVVGVLIGVLVKIVYDWLRGVDRYNWFEQKFVTLREFEFFKEQVLKRLEVIERKLDRLLLENGNDDFFAK
ncbi:MAG: hypothetical protein QXR17_06935 [Candidatus Bathyarchaeia archaeon]